MSGEPPQPVTNGGPQQHAGAVAPDAGAAQPGSPSDGSVPDRGWRCAADARRFADDSAVQQQARQIVNKLTDYTYQQLTQQMGEMLNSMIEAGDDASIASIDELVEVVYDTAVESDGPRDKHLGVMYARFCFDVCILEANANARRTGGAQLVGPTQFRKKLVGLVQRDFEKCRRGMFGEDVGLDPATLRRQATGNINFLGQLFNKKLVTDKILHGVISILLGEEGGPNPSEDSLELLFELIRAVRENCDTVKGRDRVDVCFARLTALSEDPSLSTRCRMRMRDVIELRERGWKDRATNRRGS